MYIVAILFRLWAIEKRERLRESGVRKRRVLFKLNYWDHSLPKKRAGVFTPTLTLWYYRL